METDTWLGVELRHLLAILAIHEEGSFGKAADRLGYTQSAVSQQIAALERMVGTVLIDRPASNRPARLTPAGEAIVEHAQSIRAHLIAARADVAHLMDPARVRLALGLFQSAGTRIIPELMRRMRATHPHVDLQLVESNSDDELVELVETCELDATFATLPVQAGPVDWLEVLKDPYLLLVHAESELATRAELRIPHDLASLEMIGFTEGHSVAEAERQFRHAGISTQFVTRSNDNATIQALVRTGIGAAVMPRLAVDEHDDGVVAIDLSAYVPPRVIVLAWHRDRRRSTALDGLISEVKDTALEAAP
jgi:DNA-binding transcriptional LysR family regulator